MSKSGEAAMTADFTTVREAARDIGQSDHAETDHAQARHPGGAATSQPAAYRTRPRGPRLRMPALFTRARAYVGSRSKTTFIAVVATVAVVGAAFYWLVLLPPHSIQAFVNTDLVLVRAPITGRLSIAPGLQLGSVVEPGQTLATIASDVANTRVSQLRITRAEGELAVAALEAQIESLKDQKTDRDVQLALFTKETDTDERLRIGLQEAELTTAKQELERANAALSVAKATESRSEALVARRIVSQVGYEVQFGAVQGAEAAVASQKARIAAAEAQLEASRVGLQLDGARTLNTSELRRRELQLQASDLDRQRTRAEATLAATRRQLAVVAHELDEQHETRLVAPEGGVVWSVDVPTGDDVVADNRILRLANCQSRWVEAFFDEADAAQVAVGRSVEVSLLRGQRRWTGTIETVRAGTGRVDVGDHVVTPPPEITRRQLPVRVITARIALQWQPQDMDPQQFCLAGRSLNVVVK